MAGHQLQPFEEVDLGAKKSSLKIFEDAVMKYRGAVSQEDSDRAPLPKDHPYAERRGPRLYEAEKPKLQIERLKVPSWVKDRGARIVSLFARRDAAGTGGTSTRSMEQLTPRSTRMLALETHTCTEPAQS